jgi:thiol:disulfide interchange protein DsbC
MLTRAKLGEDIPIPPHLCANPVEKEYQLGVDLGIHGTPSLLLPDGELLDGLVPVDWLAQHLAEADAAGAIPGARAH